MDYLSGYYWRQGDRDTALALKQPIFSGGTSVVFACWVEDEQRNLWIEQVISWFQEMVLPACGRKRAVMKSMEKGLRKLLGAMPCCPRGAGLVLCIGDAFLAWGRGGQGLWFINTRLGKPHFQCLLAEETAEDSIISGILEPGVGLLSANSDFFKGVTQEQMLGCLAVEKLGGEDRLQKRLQELGEEAVRKGQEHPAAVLVVTR